MQNRQRRPLESLFRLYLYYMLQLPVFFQFAFEETIDVAGALEVETGLGVAELQEEARGVDSIEGLLHREAALVHQTGDEVFHNLLLHVLEFCLRYVHFLISLSIARWVQKAYWKVMPLMYWMRRRNSSKVM